MTAFWSFFYVNYHRLHETFSGLKPIDTSEIDEIKKWIQEEKWKIHSNKELTYLNFLELFIKVVTYD